MGFIRMYVCVCNAVTDTDIKKAVKAGANCLHHLESMLGVSNQCGSCVCDAKSCLEKTLEQEIGSADLVNF
jgi:bacterioferritin-associated ferredoxin